MMSQPLEPLPFFAARFHVCRPASIIISMDVPHCSFLYEPVISNNAYYFAQQVRRIASILGDGNYLIPSGETVFVMQVDVTP